MGPALALLAAVALGTLALLGDSPVCRSVLYEHYNHRPKVPYRMKAKKGKSSKHDGTPRKSRTQKEKWESPEEGEGPPGQEVYYQKKEKIDVLLIENYAPLGQAGETVSVKRGRFRNFLLPHEIAIRLNDPLAGSFKAQQMEKKEVKKELAQKATAQQLQQKKQIEELGTVSFSRKLSDEAEGKIFGSVTPTNVGEVLTQMTGIPIRINSIEVPRINKLGTYSVRITIGPDTVAIVQVEVVPEES